MSEFLLQVFVEDDVRLIATNDEEEEDSIKGSTLIGLVSKSSPRDLFGGDSPGTWDEVDLMTSLLKQLFVDDPVLFFVFFAVSSSDEE